MKKVYYQIEINCPREQVFPIMLDEKYYREWTAQFNPTSHYEGSWNEGSRILFLGEDKNGEKGGMYSSIEKHVPNEFISIKHLGMLEKGKETSFENDIYENYRLEEQNGRSLLKIEIDTEDAWQEYFDSTWPKALQRLKEICEKNYHS